MIRPLHPKRGHGWSTFRQMGWHRHTSGLFAMSTLDKAAAPDDTGDVIPQWHVSVSRRWDQRSNLVITSEHSRDHRPTNAEVVATALAFGMDQWEEDNHQPGMARHLWLPVDPARRVDCECKVDELTMVEPDGYTWTTPRGSDIDPSICRGCEFQRMLGLSCSIHTPAVTP